jgi:hypothetical protein
MLGNNVDSMMGLLGMCFGAHRRSSFPSIEPAYGTVLAPALAPLAPPQQG